MNLKKILVSLSTIIMLVIFILVQNVVYAATLPSGQEIYFGIVELMTHDTPNMGYAIASSDENMQRIKLWNIVKYNSATSTEYDDVNMYCIKAGVGFTTVTEGGTLAPRQYNVFYDMQTERENIKAQNDILKDLVEKTITENGTTYSRYDALLAVLDMLYLPGESPVEEKTELINTILECAMYNADYSAYTPYVELMQTYPLTDNDINAIQQAVIWYFTNYGEEDGKYDQTGKNSWLEYTLNGTSYETLTNYTPNNLQQQYDAGTARNYQAEILYNYMIKQAKANANQYTDSSSTAGAPAQVNSTVLEGVEEGENYIVGPINISENSSNIPYTIDFVVRNYATSVTNYKLLDENKNEVAEGTTIKDLAKQGKDFYISIKTDSLEKESSYVIQPNGKGDIDNNGIIDETDAQLVQQHISGITSLTSEQEERADIDGNGEINTFDTLSILQYVSGKYEYGISVNITVNYSDKTMKVWASSTNNQEQPLAEIVQENKSVPVILTLELKEEKPFDLALRKYITKVNDVELTGANVRVPNIDETTLTSGTATYKHKKDPVTVETGDKVTYKMTIYNEGEKAGRATKIIDQLPTGLQFNRVVSGNFELGTYDETTNTLNLVRTASNTDNLSAYTNGNLASETIEIECTVTATPDNVDNKVLTNVAWIAEEIDSEGNVIITNQTGADRDSEPATYPNVNKDSMSNYAGKENKTDLSDSEYYYKGEQDDDDFEKLVLLPESFDLKLIKRITAVNNQNVPERIESIDASKLNTLGTDGKMITTADYDLNKDYVGVKKGDIVTYTFRIYNEGTIDGYAQEITEDVPEGLQFLWSEKEGEELKADTTLTEEEKEAIEFNQKYLWGKFKYDDAKENIIQISSDYLSKENETTVGGNLITAFGKNDGTKTESDLHYKEVAVKFKVISENVAGTVIRNEAAITEDCDENGDPVDDRDSSTDDWVKYEDDEDYDNIILQSFDLALRKFIIAVSDDTKIENEEYLKDKDGSYTRAPVVDTSKLNTVDESGKLITTAIYNHTKEPVMVKHNDIVVYMLRVYNEADMNGYASEIKDHLPPYLEFVDDEFNKQYGWEVSEDGRTVTTRYLENELINKAETNTEGKIVLSYKEVPIMCRVSEQAKTSENITNIADITEYLNENKTTVTDRDSQPDNVNLPEDKDLPNYKDNETGKYVPGQQDDDDFEKVIVKTFDLALRKWVTEAIVIENGKQTVTQTGHQPYDDPEQVVKVELHRKKLDQVTVKFRYSIRVINEGEVEGYAKEITDYVPQGLKFVAEDNPGWTDEGNNVISTRLLENTLLQPGEYADVEVVLTWINNENNMGVMINTAEISEDDNPYDLPDKDSTPDNKKDGEDDIDDAPVMLSVTTGQIRIYFTLGFIVLITIASGVILIKKFVL